MGWASGLTALAGLGGALIKGGVDTPEFRPVQLPDASTGFADFFKQAGQIDPMSAFLGRVNDVDNAAYRERLGQVDPNLIGNVSKAGEKIGEFIEGKLPEDVSRAVARASAERAVAGGFGAGSGMGRNLTARDLGLTSLSLMDRGMGMLRNQMGLAQALTPANATVGSMMMTPGQFLQRQDQQALANSSAANQNAAAGYQNQVSQANNWSQFLNSLAQFGAMQSMQGYFNPAPTR